MTEEIDWSARAPHVKHRNCPSCGTELKVFHLSAMLMPIEQFTMRHLQSVNAALQHSIRPFGMQSLNELQLLMFISPCPECSLISSWDFGTEELNEIVTQTPHPPYATIAWNYEPETIERHLTLAPEWLKPSLQALLDTIAPKVHDESKS